MPGRSLWQWARCNTGFSLIEIMLATAIIAILALTAAPSIMAYRHKSRVAAITATTKQIHDALANYAMDHTGGGYPPAADVSDWQALRDIVRAYSGAISDTETEMGIQAIVYTSSDDTTYELKIIVDVPDGVIGKTFVITPDGITKQ